MNEIARQRSEHDRQMYADMRQLDRYALVKEENKRIKKALEESERSRAAKSTPVAIIGGLLATVGCGVAAVAVAPIVLGMAVGGAAVGAAGVAASGVAIAVNGTIALAKHV